MDRAAHNSAIGRAATGTTEWDACRTGLNPYPLQAVILARCSPSIVQRACCRCSTSRTVMAYLWCCPHPSLTDNISPSHPSTTPRFLSQQTQWQILVANVQLDRCLHCPLELRRQIVGRRTTWSQLASIKSWQTQKASLRRRQRRNKEAVVAQLCRVGNA